VLIFRTALKSVGSQKSQRIQAEPKCAPGSLSRLDTWVRKDPEGVAA
jgi:hypothetical protein